MTHESLASEAILLSRDQAVKLMAISVMLKDEELSFFGDDAQLASDEMSDIGEEIALQLAGYPA